MMPAGFTGTFAALTPVKKRYVMIKRNLAHWHLLRHCNGLGCIDILYRIQ